MQDPNSARLDAARMEEFEKLLGQLNRGAGVITKREEEELWRQADLIARERVGSPGYSQVKWGERYYDHLGPMPGWRKKERPNYVFGIVVIAVLIAIWFLGGRGLGF